MPEINFYVEILIAAVVTIVWITIITKSKVKRYFQDLPNNRSSHALVVTRGAGFSFFLSALISTIGFVGTDRISSVLWIWLIGGAIVACVGLVDDFKSLNAKLRLSFQALSVLFFVFICKSTPQHSSDSLSVAILVWSLAYINFYNFADGINGHVALQSIAGIVSWMVYCVLVQRPTFFLTAGQVPIAILCSLVVFLWFNMVRKSVFMGDTGSTFLGYFFAAIMIFHSYNAPTRFDAIKNLLPAFFFSAVIMLDCGTMVFAKICNGLSPVLPHNQHLYQRMSRWRKFNHGKASFVLLLIQILISAIFIASAAMRVDFMWSIAFLLVSVYTVYSLITNWKAIRAVKQVMVR